jgi:predicted amidophosphoribosyltransferase
VKDGGWFQLMDYLIPKLNRDFSSIHAYLTNQEIQSFKVRIKRLKLKQSKVLDKVVVMSDYKNELLQDLIQRAKFQGEWAIAKDLSQLIYQKIWVENEIFLPTPDILAFVPPDPWRLLGRGYHLPAKITQELSKLTDVKAVEVLVKKKSTRPQVGLERKQRLENLNGVIEFKSRGIKENPGKWEVIWLIDDIVSTGRTFEVCAKEIKKQLPFVQVYGIAVAGN